MTPPKNLGAPLDASVGGERKSYTTPDQEDAATTAASSASPQAEEVSATVNPFGKWYDDPIGFIEHHFKAKPDPWQVDALKAYVIHHRLAMKACKGPGKTTVLAWMTWHFLATRSHSKVAVTSITADNLTDGLWTELAKWQLKSPELKKTFAFTKTRISHRRHPEDWWASARAWTKGADASQQADTLAGLHADHLLFVLDECGGIPDAVMAAAEAALATGGDTRLAMAGNPTALDGALHRACTRDRHLWHLIDITGDPADPKRTDRVSLAWAKEQIDKYGADNPWVQVNVFGKFPATASTAILGPDAVAAAINRSLPTDATAGSARILGLDIALYGDDRTVIFPRQGPVSYKPVIMRHASGVEVAARAAKAAMQWNADAIFIDSTGGWAGPVPHLLREAGLTVFEIDFSGSAIDKRYFNKRSEMWLQMSEWVKAGGVLPNLSELTRELTEPTYGYQGGKFRLEEKRQLKQRLGWSPDLADALALTFAMPVMARKDQPHSLRATLEDHPDGAWMLQSLQPQRTRAKMTEDELT